MFVSFIFVDCSYINNQCSVSCAHSAEIDLEMATFSHSAFDIGVEHACSIVPQVLCKD